MTSLKIVTWNCHGGFRTKFHLIDNLCPDIVVIQECEDPLRIGGAYENWAGNYHWIGENRNKGLGVFVRAQIELKKLDWDDHGLKQFLPCRINESCNLIAVWTKQTSPPKFNYVGQLWKYLQLHKLKMPDDAGVICGDFNSNVCWDKLHGSWNHSAVVRELDEIGFHSMYHSETREIQGSESEPTFYLNRNLENPYHIDYAFVSKTALTADGTMSIGTPDVWLAHSDHMPLSFSITA